MKKISWILLLFFWVTVFPANAQASDEDLCKKYPLNSKCKAEKSDGIEDSNNVQDYSNSEIIDTLTPENVTRYLKELGYINVKPFKERSLQVAMQGQNCLIFVSSNGKGMSITNTFPASTQVSSEDLNEWNNSLRFSYAYNFKTKNNEERLVLESTMLVSGGVTEENIKSFLRFFPGHQTRFNQFLADLSQ